MATVYSIISGKGGVGKTTSTINLGAAINSLNQSVILVDANLSTPNISLHLGSPILPLTLNHILTGKAETVDAIYEHHSGIKILPGSLSINTLSEHPKKFNNIIKELKKISNHIILDSSAGLGKETELSISAADEIILVTQAEMPSITNTLKTAKLAEQLNKPIKGLILTRHQNRKTEMPITNILDMLEVPLLGIIPEDKNMQKSLYLKDALIHTHPRSKASKAYREIASNLLGKQPQQRLYSRILTRLGLK